ncbi:hypothetical protein Q4I30_001781, partial [Leishmania utingensis]
GSIARPGQLARRRQTSSAERPRRLIVIARAWVRRQEAVAPGLPALRRAWGNGTLRGQRHPPRHRDTSMVGVTGSLSLLMAVGTGPAGVCGVGHCDASGHQRWRHPPAARASHFCVSAPIAGWSAAPESAGLRDRQRQGGADAHHVDHGLNHRPQLPKPPSFTRTIDVPAFAIVQNPGCDQLVSQCAAQTDLSGADCTARIRGRGKEGQEEPVRRMGRLDSRGLT